MNSIVITILIMNSQSSPTQPEYKLDQNFRDVIPKPKQRFKYFPVNKTAINRFHFLGHLPTSLPQKDMLKV